MLLTAREVNEVVVLRLSGKLDAANRGVLTEKVSSLVFQGRRQIVLNLSEVSYMDSGGLGELVSCHSIAGSKGSTVALAALGPRMQTLLIMSRLLPIFSVFDTEDEAVQGFAKGA